MIFFRYTAPYMYKMRKNVKHEPCSAALLWCGVRFYLTLQYSCTDYEPSVIDRVFYNNLQPVCNIKIICIRI